MSRYVRYQLDDLKFVLDNLFFSREHNREGEYDNLTFEFEDFKGSENPGNAPDGNDDKLWHFLTRELYGKHILEVDEVVDDAARLVHYLRIYENLKNEGGEGDEGYTSPKYLNTEATRILKKYYRKPSSNVPRHNMYSCVPKTRIPVNEGEVAKMEGFLRKVCSEKYFKKVRWAMESGKHEDKPNLHFHIFGLFNANGSKNFRKRALVTLWDKMYPGNPLDWKRGSHVGIHVKFCGTELIINDTLSYLDNECKGDHENFLDLEKSDGFGF